MSYPSYPEYKNSEVYWLGNIPRHWDIKPLKFLTVCLDGKRIPLNGEQRAEMPGDVPYWGANAIMGHVDRPIFNEALVLIGEDGAPFLDPSKSVAFLSEGPVWPNNHIHVLRPEYPGWAKFIVRALNSTDFATFIEGATRDKLTQSKLMNIPVCWPSASERDKITRFLDHQTTRIDALIAEQQRLIELLKEKRQAVISHAVTKGLDPDVAMKDSGVEWLGEVPEHWTLVQFRRVMVGQTRNGLYKSEQEQDPNGTLFIQMGETFRDRVYIGGSSQRVKSKPEELAKWGLQEGDLLFARRSIVLEGSGRCTRIGPIKEPHLFESSMIRVRPDKRMVVPEFIHFLFDSSPIRAQMLATTKTVTISGIDSSQLKSLKLVLPPVDEQDEIARYIDHWQSALFDLEGHAYNSIELLMERRSALISAAVTGKIDVRDLEPPTSETFPKSTASEETPA